VADGGHLYGDAQLRLCRLDISKSALIEGMWWAKDVVEEALAMVLAARSGVEEEDPVSAGCLVAVGIGVDASNIAVDCKPRTLTLSRTCFRWRIWKSSHARSSSCSYNSIGWVIRFLIVFAKYIRLPETPTRCYQEGCGGCSVLT
jgi:hypothetical protein